MGIFDFLFGSPSSTGSTTTQNITTAPPYVQAGLESLVTRGQQISEQPYEAFPGQRIEGFDPLEEQAFNQVASTQNQYSPYYGTALGISQGAAAPITDVSAYMNPYTQQVVDATMAEMNQQAAMGLNSLRASTVNSGGLSNNRLGLAESDYLTNQDALMAQTVANLYSQGYTQANELARADQQRALQAAQSMGQISAQGQLYDLTGAGALQSAGQAQRGMGQSNLDVAYQDFLNQRDWEMNQLKNYASILQGSPIGAVTSGQQTTTSTVPGPSATQNIAGLGTIGLSGYMLADQLFGKRGGLVHEKGITSIKKYAEGGMVQAQPQHPMLRNAAQPGVQYPMLQNELHTAGVQHPLLTAAMQPGVQYPVLRNAAQPGIQYPKLQEAISTPGVQLPILQNASQPGVQYPKFNAFINSGGAAKFADGGMVVDPETEQTIGELWAAENPAPRNPLESLFSRMEPKREKYKSPVMRYKTRENTYKDIEKTLLDELLSGGLRSL